MSTALSEARLAADSEQTAGAVKKGASRKRSGPSASISARTSGGGGAAERGPKRLRQPGGAPCAWAGGALRRAPREDLPERAEPVAAGTGLVPLRRLSIGMESARPGVGPAGHVAVTRRHADGGVGGGRGQLRQGRRTVGGVGRGADRRQAGRTHHRKPWDARSTTTNAP